MADSFLAYQNPTTTDKKLDSESLTVGVNTVERERIQIAGDDATDIAPVTAADGLLVNLGANNDITVASLPLPSGASTAAKQPALGTAGTASADVITVQGIASMTALNVAQSGTWTVQPGNTANSTPWLVTDGASSATGAAVPSKAGYQGGIATTSLPTAATPGNLVGEFYDKFGRSVVVLGTVRDLVGTQTTTISASTSETTIVTATASVFNDLVMLIVSNTSASTNTRIDFRDTTAGSVLFSLYSVGGAPPVGFALPVPIPQTTVNTNWTAQCATSTTDIRIYAVFQKNK